MSEMIYRSLPRGGEKISILGMGMGSIHESSEQEIISVLSKAIDCGMNYFDMAASEDIVYPAYGKAFRGRRSKVFLQMHFGAVFDENGMYGWSKDIGRIRETFEGQLRTIGTDYADFGYIHCIDEMDDLDEILNGKVFEYICKMKNAGAVRHIGVSTHTPSIAVRFIETGMADMIMFSINPAFDYQKGGSDAAIGTNAERADVYKQCEKNGVGIIGMKPFSGGQLLDGRTSQFGKALTRVQCLQYVLDRPAVIAALPGIRNMSDLDTILTYLDAGEKERDYSIIGSMTPGDAAGRCVYCSHCHPCPQGIDIGLVNKYYDLAVIGDSMAADHYLKLSHHASDCIKCGHCEARCPFDVKQESRMEEIANHFSI